MAKGHGCGCSTKGAKLYIVKTPGHLRATKCRAKAEKLVRSCRRKHKSSQCTWVPTKGARKAKRHGRK